MKILILHGWGQNKKLWQHIVEQLAVNYDVEAIDLPGFGDEPLVKNDWEIRDYAKWVIKYVESKGYQDVVLLGHSFGGRIASYVASQNPDWLKLVILYAAPALFRPIKQVKLRNTLAKYLKYLFPKTLKKYFKSGELQHADSNNLGKIYRHAINFDYTEDIKQIKVKTFIIWGTNDEETPARIGKEMHELIPNSELILLQGEGHNIHITSPSLFYATVKRILENIK